MGWYTVYKGQEFLIYEKWGKMERWELIFTYRLGKPGLGWGRKRYNDKISGMTILGEVLSTERETVRLKLDIDEGWNPGGPYPYTWRPETGNMMYCMPQVGTRVSLYFPNYDEQMAMAVNCVRTNGGSCTRMSDPSKRSFVTEHGKEMNLYPQEMSLLGGANGMVKLEDETGISISTDKGIMVVALGPVSISGKVAVATALMGEVVMAKGNILTGEMKTTQVQSNQYDLLAADFTRIEGWNQQIFEAYDDAPQEGSFDWGGLIGNVLAGLAVVGAVALTLVTLGAATPVIVGAIAVGTAAVIGQGISDYASGTVSSTETYMRTGFIGAVAGAFSGAVSGVVGSGAGTLLGRVTSHGASVVLKAGADGVSGVIETFVENTIMGQRTTLSDLKYAFLLSAGTGGIGDNFRPLQNWLRQSSGVVDNAFRQMDQVVRNFGEQVGQTLDNMARQMGEMFGNPRTPVPALVFAGVVGQADDFLETAERRLDDLGQDTVHHINMASDSEVGALKDRAQSKLQELNEDFDFPEQQRGGKETEDYTDFNSKSPMFGEDWHKYFNEIYGQENVMWESASIEDIVDLPSTILEFSPDQVINLAKNNGWSIGPLRQGSLAGIPYENGGGLGIHPPNGRSEYIQYHPGGGHHGESPYYKVSSGRNGIKRYYIEGDVL